MCLPIVSVVRSDLPPSWGEIRGKAPRLQRVRLGLVSGSLQQDYQPLQIQVQVRNWRLRAFREPLPWRLAFRVLRCREGQTTRMLSRPWTTLSGSLQARDSRWNAYFGIAGLQAIITHGHQDGPCL